jgi:hypothetical protein
MSRMYVAWRPPLGLLSMDTARAVAQGFPLHVLPANTNAAASVSAAQGPGAPIKTPSSN